MAQCTPKSAKPQGQRNEERFTADATESADEKEWVIYFGSLQCDQFKETQVAKVAKPVYIRKPHGTADCSQTIGKELRGLSNPRLALRKSQFVIAAHRYRYLKLLRIAAICWQEYEKCGAGFRFSYTGCRRFQ
jgi:hypothetical protein